MPQPTAIWNTARDAWEVPNTESLFCGHLAVYSETFPTSGMTRSGVAYALPTWAHRTDGSGCSSSPSDDDLLGTPTSRMWKGAGPQGGPTQIRNKARGLIEAQVMDLLPTPSANVGTNGGSQHPDKRRAGNHQPSIQDVAEHVLLPVAACPTCGCPEDLHDGGDFCGGPCGGNGYNCYGRMPEAEFRLLQTPTVGVTLGGSRSRSGARSDEKLLPAQAEEMTTDWGPYAPAIRRWERVLGQPAPSPTEPNKAGNPRLSPRFTEWLMGVPAGWITGAPISRNEQLKACGNGVVPQQAAAALADMLAAFDTGDPHAQ